ncbi:NADPH-dependent FMN reductase [Sorangium cellulosum]|uniref:Flavoprotein n=1 Tax=Sorangium cellulosum TaxID=56 RepID=A0A150QUX3_SORCE|nr:NAD(P)H-dependent oxidoreductase [Sorangium cellulosum]KYF71632.1 flavoprotein [Sorangium cellulosum]
MKLAVISGSHRNGSESGKVARYVQQQLTASADVTSTYALDLADNPLPLWEPEAPQLSEKWARLWSPVSAELTASDAFVIVAPEWGGMVPAGLKNFFLLCTRGELAHKPALIIAVSAGAGGAYPIAELRMSSYKNSYLCYIPDHVIVRNVRALLNEPAAPQSPDDERIRERLRYALGVLLQYGKALQQVRASGAIDLPRYPFGM